MHERERGREGGRERGRERGREGEGGREREGEGGGGELTCKKGLYNSLSTFGPTCHSSS